MTTSGSCMCGEITYEYTGEPAATALCHCKDCQKWSGGAYTSNVVIPRSDFKVTSSTKPKEFDIKGDSGKVNKHLFCGTCGSSLYTALEVMPDVYCVKAGGLDGGKTDLGGKVAVEFYTKDRLPFVTAVEGAKQEKAFG